MYCCIKLVAVHKNIQEISIFQMKSSVSLPYFFIFSIWPSGRFLAPKKTKKNSLLIANQTWIIAYIIFIYLT